MIEFLLALLATALVAGGCIFIAYGLTTPAILERLEKPRLTPVTPAPRAD